MIDHRDITLRGADNVRDLGGLPTRDGRRTRYGRLIRSATLQELTAADVASLVDRIGVRLVVDLRLPEEAQGEGRGPLAERVGAYANLPLRSADMMRADVLRDVAGIDLLTHYLEFLEASGPEVVAAVRLLADPVNQPALFHCAAGKDRTGVLAAILLDAVGVEETAIVADYALTGAHMDRVVARLSRLPWYREPMSLVPAEAHLAAPQTMQSFLHRLHAEHGGAAAWLTARGLDPAALESLRRSLVAGVEGGAANGSAPAAPGGQASTSL
jgi:protein-tyrosine phosphatase